MHHRRHDANANAAACGLHYVELSCEVAPRKLPINSIKCKKYQIHPSSCGENRFRQLFFFMFFLTILCVDFSHTD